MSTVYETDVAIIGGGFSGSSAAVLLRREVPDLKILVIEKSLQFDRKVGEASTEVSGCFMTKRLGITHHLNHQHIVKNGLRFWFSQSSADAFDQCGELGAGYQVRLPSYQLDREVLDQHLLDMAATEGAEVWRPAKVRAFEQSQSLEGEPRAALQVDRGEERIEVRARWVLDASGRAGLIPRQLGLWRKLESHPTNAIWGRFRKVADWDGYDLRHRHPDFGSSCHVSRASATNHLTGYGWWCWIIPLRGGDFSLGLVYDSRLYTPPEGGKLSERLKAHVMQHPVGKELFAGAEAVEGDVKAFSHLPYYCEEIAGANWQAIGDTCGFMDPLYSQGLDYCSWTVAMAVDRIRNEREGKVENLTQLNADFRQSYHAWFEGLYKNKYHYLGDSELMTAAFLMDIGLFFFGPVRETAKCPQKGFSVPPFIGKVDRQVAKLMAFYNHRLAVIAQKRKAAGCYGKSNLNFRRFVSGFTPEPSTLKLVGKGLWYWLRAEWDTIRLPKIAA